MFKSDIVGVINFEMIGYFHAGDLSYPDELLKIRYATLANSVRLTVGEVSVPGDHADST